METVKQFVTIRGVSYLVTEHSGYLKAHLNGYFGWTSVWAASEEALLRRVQQVRTGGQ
jgi:hypothetical protein